MTIVMTGGGSGGHITPVLAVAQELKRRSPDTQLIYIGQRGDSMRGMVDNHEHLDGVYFIRAGKFRRYNGQSFLFHLLDIPTLLKNIRDVFYVLIGTVQSYFLLGRIKPAAVFLKGGYIGVPVGLAAAARRIPIITHDSDAMPGLANRMVSRWVSAHAVGMPKDFYAYPANKTHYVGVPVGSNFIPVTTAQQALYRRALGISEDAFVVLVTGGGLGAQRLNDAVRASLPGLIKAIPDLYLIAIVGQQNTDQETALFKAMDEAMQAHVEVHGFVKEMYRYSGAADVVVTRSGATAMAEMAIQHKACVVVPNPYLTGGHQLKNAQQLAKTGAVRVVTEAELKSTPHTLVQVVSELASQPKERQALADKLGMLAKPQATSELTDIIMAVAQGGETHETAV